MKIEAKTVVITGGASGLGAGTAKRLYKLGANIVIADMNAQVATAITAELGERAIFAEMNVTNSEEVADGMKLAVDTFGSLDILVNCAGTGFGMRTVGKNGPHDLGIFKTIIDINLIGTFDAIRHAAFHMQSNTPQNQDGEKGVIVNTASVAAFDGQIGQAAYAASKAGVAGMTLPVARDLSVIGVRVCTIAPGTFDTPLMMAASEEVRTSLAQQIPFPKRFGTPDEFAMLVQQIVENPMMNGEIIRLDGSVRMGPQ